MVYFCEHAIYTKLLGEIVYFCDLLFLLFLIWFLCLHFPHICSSAENCYSFDTVQCNLLLAKEQWCSVAGKVTWCSLLPGLLPSHLGLQGNWDHLSRWEWDHSQRIDGDQHCERCV